MSPYKVSLNILKRLSVKKFSDKAYMRMHSEDDFVQPFLNVHALISSEAGGLIFSHSTHLTPYSVDAF